MKPVFLVMTVALGVCCTGCGKSHGWGGGGTAKSEFRNGVNCSYTIDNLHIDGRRFLVLAVDGCSGSSLIAAPMSQGSFKALDGRAINWTCTTPDGATGTVTIAGQQYQLEAGPLFLVSLKDNQTRVEQVKVDLSKFQLQFDTNLESGLEAVAETEPNVKAFLKECRGDRAPPKDQ